MLAAPAPASQPTPPPLQTELLAAARAMVETEARIDELTTRLTEHLANQLTAPTITIDKPTRDHTIHAIGSLTLAASALATASEIIIIAAAPTTPPPPAP